MLLEPVLRVICHTDLPQELREGALGNRVESVTIRATKKKLAPPVEPTSAKRIPIMHRLPSGEAFDIGPLSASFALEDVSSISSLDKKGEFYVDIVAADGETKEFKIKSKNFDELP